MEQKSTIKGTSLLSALQHPKFGQINFLGINTKLNREFTTTWIIRFLSDTNEKNDIQ
jgi:hypothetical protein